MDSTSIIRSLFEPTLELDELSIIDNQYGSNGHKAGERPTEIQSVEFPFVQINSYIFLESEIISLEIETLFFLPTIKIIVALGNNPQFLSTSFPKDGDLVSIFLRGRDDLFKPVRNDYLITGIQSLSTQTAEGGGTKLLIEGKLNIPGLYDDTSLAILGTSLDVLKEIASQLNLGFATNVDFTDDMMPWVCPNDSKEIFISTVASSAWKDEFSFFTVFIDIYYHLNFINVNSQFPDETEALLGLSDNPTLTAFLSDKQVDKSEARKILSNNPNFENSPFYIKSYKPINKSSDISRKHGYIYNLNFFEHNSLTNWVFPIEPMITEGSAETKVLLKGRPGEDFYKSQQKSNYIGIQYSYPDHNMHENYYLAKAQNMMNLAEIDKMNLEVSCKRINLNFIRFEKVPVILTITDNEFIAAKLDDQMKDEFSSEKYAEGLTVDRLYTGFYAIKGYRIKFKRQNASTVALKNPPLEQIFLLTRREWPSITGE